MPLSPVSIVEFESIDSTNTEAHRRASDGERGPLWIRSDAQVKGRGRSGRHWSSPAGNLSATYMFTPQCERTVFHQLSFVAGIAGFDAIAAHLSEKTALQLKWPNDLLIGGAKVGGILVESSKYGGDIVVMIGMGINIAVRPEIDDRTVTQLDLHGHSPAPQQLLEDLAAITSKWLQIWNNGTGFDEVRTAWLDRAHAIGQPLSVNTNDKHLIGAFQGLAENGALLLALDSGETVRIEHGDVSLVSTVLVSKERA